jgi:hypothetical protein
LKKSGVDLDRKILADLAVKEPEAFAKLAETATHGGVSGLAVLISSPPSALTCGTNLWKQVPDWKVERLGIPALDLSQKQNTNTPVAIASGTMGR